MVKNGPPDSDPVDPVFPVFLFFLSRIRRKTWPTAQKKHTYISRLSILIYFRNRCMAISSSVKAQMQTYFSMSKISHFLSLSCLPPFLSACFLVKWLNEEYVTQCSQGGGHGSRGIVHQMSCRGWWLLEAGCSHCTQDAIAGSAARTQCGFHGRLGLEP